MRTTRGLVLLALLILSCSRRSESPDIAAPAPEDLTPLDGGRLVRRLESDVNTLNFLLHTTEYENFVLSYLYAPLIDFDIDQKIVPRLARTWEISEDGKLYRFHLDPKASFEDGTPVRARDVLFTLGKIVEKDSGAFQLTAAFEELDLPQCKVINETTVELAFKTARASQLSAFNIAILSEKTYGKGDFKKDFNRKAFGNGPYRLSRYVPGKEIVLQRRIDHWETTPHIQTIVFKIISDDTVAWNAMRRGDIDEMSITSDRWKREGGSPAVKQQMEIVRFYSGYNFIPWNCRNPLLSDARVRRALMMCLDRRSIIQNIYYGTARIMTGPFTPDQWTHNSDVGAIEYDLEGARQSFAEAGWRDTNGDGVLDRGGKRFELEILIHAGNQPSVGQAQIFQEALKQVGVKMNIVTLDSASFFARIQKGDYQAAFLAQGTDVDPDLDVSQFHSSQFPPAGNNWAFYSNPEVDALIVRGRTEFDPASRLEIYKRLHEVLAYEQPYGWIVEYSNKWAVSRRVHEAKVSRTGGLFFWYAGPLDWWLSDKPAARW